MPRKTPIPTHEKEIGLRFRMARERSGIRQADLARRVGIPPGRLAEYELGRNPMPFWVGAKIARETNTCQRWLCNGREPQQPFIRTDEALESAVKKAWWFSTVCEALLLEEIDALVAGIAKVSREPEATVDHEFFAGFSALCAPAAEMKMDSLKMALRNVIAVAETGPTAEIQKLTEAVQQLAAKACKIKRKRGSLPWKVDLAMERIALASGLENRLRDYIQKKAR